MHLLSQHLTSNQIMLRWKYLLTIPFPKLALLQRLPLHRYFKEITLHIAITIRGALFLDSIGLKKDIVQCFLHISFKLLKHIAFAFTTSSKSNHGKIRIFTSYTFPQTDINAMIAATPLFETNTLRIAITIRGPLFIQLSWIQCTQYTLQMVKNKDQLKRIRVLAVDDLTGLKINDC